MFKKIFIGFVFLLLTSISLIYVLQVKEVVYEGDLNCKFNKEEIEKDIKGKNILLTSSTKISKKLKNQTECLESVEVSKIYPNKIKIKLTSIEIAVKIAETNLYLTKEAKIIEAQNLENIIVLYLPKELILQNSKKIEEPTVLFVSRLAPLLLKTDFSPESIRILSSTEVTAYNREAAVAVFTSKKSEVDQVDSLQYVLAKAKIDSTKIAKIDLRFDKPVIVNK